MMHFNTISLEDRIDKIKAELADRGTISEVAEIVGLVVTSIQSDFDSHKTYFQDEIRSLINEIEQTKIDVLAIKPKFLSHSKIPEASSQLDQIVLATEDAATKIMDSAEEISELAASVTQAGDEKLAACLMKISTEIFEASSFQDITGQRVNKVVTTLKALEEKLSILADVIGDIDSHIIAKEEENNDLDSKEKLLQGPQCAVTSNDQDAIDALFDSF